MTGATIAAPPAAPPAGPAPKLLGLELLRFACALGVLIFHFKHFAMTGASAPLTANPLPLNFLLAPIYRFGAYGVEIFWCISGFIFYWKYAAIIAARAITPMRFFWLRFSRLYPLHFVTLMAVAALQPIHAALAGQPFVYADNGLGRFVLQLALADQWAGAHPFSFNGPIWSVSAEVFVYFAFFLLVRTFGTMRWLIGAAVAAGLVCIWAEAVSPAVICAAYFFAGGAAAQAWRDAARRRQWQVAAIAVLVAGAIAAPLLDLGSNDDRALLTWLLVMIPPSLVLAARDAPWLDRGQRGITAAGNLTYSIYLLHFPLQLAFVTLALAVGFVPPVGEAWFLAAYLAASIAIGRFVFVGFEAPAQAMIRAATVARVGRPVAV